MELKLGHHVEVQHDGNLLAKQIGVTSEVEGKVKKNGLAIGNVYSRKMFARIG